MENYYIYEIDDNKMYTFSGGMVNVDEDTTGGYSHNIQVSPDEKFAVAVGYDRVMSFDLSTPSNPNKQATIYRPFLPVARNTRLV